MSYILVEFKITSTYNTLLNYSPAILAFRKGSAPSPVISTSFGNVQSPTELNADLIDTNGFQDS